MPLIDTLIIETTGKGRPYSVAHVEGWWRDFAELSLDDERRVLSFLQRRGDPFGVLAPDGTQISTHDWRDLKRVLERAATAWDPQPDETGVSHFRPEKRSRAERMFAMVTGRYADGRAADGRPDGPRTGWAEELGVAYHGGITPISPRQNARRLPVRRCRRFGARRAWICAAATIAARWFTLHYANARQCSASCRAAASTTGDPHMASFRKIRTRKGATRWQSRWRVPGANGRLQDRAQNFATRKEAAAHAAQMREIESRGVGDPHRHDLAGYLRGWLAHHRERGDLAPTTMRGYERNAALAARYCGHVLLEKLSGRDLDALYAKLLTHGSQPKGAPAPAVAAERDARPPASCTARSSRRSSGG